MTGPGPGPTIRSRIRSRSPLIGTFLNLGSPLAAEACALAGFDWLLVDLEHGGRGEDGLLGQLLAGAAHDAPVLVRVESDSRIRAGRVLDAGAAGVNLSHALGIPGRLDHPTFREALARVSRAAEAPGIAAGILAGTAEVAVRYADEGFTFVGVGSDSTALATVARQTVSSFRAAVSPAGTARASS